MTWELQTMVSDDIHRVVNSEGETLWGVNNQGFDVDHPEALGHATVELPTGDTALLLVKPPLGGLVLDAVRSYQGLTQGELHTLFLGIADELLACSDAALRLSLECIGLDAEGRPHIIPGISATPPSSVRFAIGEMIYHAGHGRPWVQSPLPVTIALPEYSAQLQTLVAGLLDESTADTGLHDTLAEVVATLRRSGTPSALPLLPAEHDLDPGQALTARLRAAKPPPALTSPSENTGTALRLRATSRDGAKQRRLRRASRRKTSVIGQLKAVLSVRGRRMLERIPSVRSWPPKQSTAKRAWGLIAMLVTVMGGAVMIGAWSAAESADSVSSTQGSATSQDSPPPQSSATSHADAEGLSESSVFALLDELCQKRSAALSSGDGEGLKALTVPGSSAAAADEVLDLHAFVGHDFSIELADLDVREQTGERLIVTARMSTSVSAEGDKKDFDPASVEFELARVDGEWRILQVTQIEG